ncbi:TadE/TadG family type IV pilus assembly protein [Cognatishimia activa]|uniref:TadE/TadG family type IV pilus assembly protein n=1 Tax=Cognatishimia activa TaxID=1715691 RepID=UPI00222F150C|nr:hypothetical protein [Cognatishimia activa]UZD91739.1 hypothetical protein M0D42_03740 [Cognatishimia activa]
MKNSMKIALSRLKAFKDNVSGSVSVEAIVTLPILLWVVAAMAVYLDVFRTKSAMDKAAFTISDALSRETNAISPDYLQNSRTLFEELAGLETDSASLRVSVISRSSAASDFEVEWSEVVGDAFVAWSDASIDAVEEVMPTVGSNETLILVETHYQYDPLYDIGPLLSGRNNESITVVDPETGEEYEQQIAWDLDMGSRNMQTFVFTRPRYAPQLVYDSNS